PIGKWISREDGTVTQTTFIGQIDLDTHPVDGWLQIASNGTFDVLVNDEIAALATTENQAVLFSASAPVVFPNRVFSTGDLPRLFGPSSGLPGTKAAYSAVRQYPRFSFKVKATGLQAGLARQAGETAARRRASSPGIASLPSYRYQLAPDAVST